MSSFVPMKLCARLMLVSIGSWSRLSTRFSRLCEMLSVSRLRTPAACEISRMQFCCTYRQRSSGSSAGGRGRRR